MWCIYLNDRCVYAVRLKSLESHTSWLAFVARTGSRRSRLSTYVRAALCAIRKPQIARVRARLRAQKSVWYAHAFRSHRARRDTLWFFSGSVIGCDCGLLVCLAPPQSKSARSFLLFVTVVDVFFFCCVVRVSRALCLYVGLLFDARVCEWCLCASVSAQYYPKY